MLLLAESLALGGRHLLVTDGNNYVVLALVQPLDLKQVEGDGVGCSGWLGLITSLDNGKLKSRGSKRMSIGFLLCFCYLCFCLEYREAGQHPASVILELALVPLIPVQIYPARNCPVFT